MFKVAPKHTETRERSGFLFLPKTLGGITQWRCRATWRQVCLHVRGEPEWFDFAWTYPHGGVIEPAQGYTYRPVIPMGLEGISMFWVDREFNVRCDRPTFLPTPAPPPHRR